MATKRFDRRANFLMRSEEYEMLEALAEHEGLRPSDTVRQLIRRAHAATFGERPAKPGKPKARKRR